MKDDARWYIVGVPLAHIVLYFMGIHFVLDFTSLFHSSPFVSSHSFPLWRSHHAALKGFDIVMSLSAVVGAFRAARRCVVSLRATTTMVFENAARSTTLMVSSSRAASNSYASCSNALLTKSDGVARSRLASWVESMCAPRRSFAASAAPAPAAPAPAARNTTLLFGLRGGSVVLHPTLCGTKTPPRHNHHIRRYAKSLSQMKEAGLKAYKPTTPGFRGRVITDRSKLWKGKPLKALTKGLTKRGGRNNSGRITVWHKGGGHKRLYRMIDFKRDLFGVNGVIRRIEYDPNRTTRIALVDYPDGIKPRYILAPEGARAGDVVSSSGGRPTNSDDDSVSSVSIDIRPGNAMPLSEMPIGTIVHNVELVPGRGGALARSAGASATLVKKGADGYCAIKLPSGELRLVPSKCVATVGVLSNREHQNTIMGKAGAKRWKGIRPTVRGTAMNPIDHPHGGGEGRSKGNNQSVSPWGVNTKGKRTRNNKRTENMRLQRRPMNRKRYPLLAK